MVVCGATGLRNDVQDSVVALSDERAVNKGTGAQGIYLHVEGVDYRTSNDSHLDGDAGENFEIPLQIAVNYDTWERGSG